MKELGCEVCIHTVCRGEKQVLGEKKLQSQNGGGCPSAGSPHVAGVQYKRKCSRVGYGQVQAWQASSWKSREMHNGGPAVG